MRLEILERGQSLKHRIALALMPLVGIPPDDVVKTAFYRPVFFGRAWLRVIRSIMRGESGWSAGERELFGTFLSRLNECRYCSGVHEHATTIRSKEVTIEQLDRWPDVDLPPRIRTTLELLEKVTRQPGAIGAADIDAVRAAGVTDAAIVDALQLAFLFNSVNRMANAFGYDFGEPARARTIAVIMDRFSYRVPEFLLR